MNALAPLKDPAVIELARNLRDLCGDDDLAFVDTLDGCSDAVEAVRRTLRAIAAWEAMEDAAKALSDRYRARAQDFAARQERARNALVQFMGEVGEKSMTLPEGTITRKAGTAKVVGEADPATMPEQFIRRKLELDRAEIKRALERGEDVPGFTLSNGAESLQIRK